MARGRARPLLGMLLGHCMWLAPACAQQVTQCTDIDVSAAQLRHGAFGGREFCCSWAPNDPDILCCPGDGTIEYPLNEVCPPDKLELQPSATPDKANFLRENVCPACLRDGTCSPGSLQLDNIQTRGPQVRSE